MHGSRFPPRFITALVLLLRAAAADDYSTAEAKIEQIESDRLPPGGRVVLSTRELNAYVQHEAPTVTDGVRDPRLELLGPGLARGTALVDFARLRASQGHPPGWLLQMLLAGEHPVSVTARVHSSEGEATVNVQRVEISGIGIDGAALDYLIQHFLLPLYPDAVVGRPFLLGHKIDRLEVDAHGVTVMARR